MRKSQHQVAKEDSEVSVESDPNKSDEEVTLSIKSILAPVSLFVIRLLRTLFSQITVIFLLTFAGIITGGLIGLLFGPALPVIAGVGGFVGLLIGVVWECRRLNMGLSYAEILD